MINRVSPEVQCPDHLGAVLGSQGLVAVVRWRRRRPVKRLLIHERRAGVVVLIKRRLLRFNCRCRRRCCSHHGWWGHLLAVGRHDHLRCQREAWCHGERWGGPTGHRQVAHPCRIVVRRRVRHGRQVGSRDFAEGTHHGRVRPNGGRHQLGGYRCRGDHNRRRHRG